MAGRGANGAAGKAGATGPVAPDLPGHDGRLVENIVHFVHALRKAGLKVGPAQVETAIRAVEVAGFTRKEDYFHTLAAVFVTRAEQREVFAQVFGLFWRTPEFLDAMINMLTPTVRRDAPEKPRPKAGQRRAEEAWGGGRRAKPPPREDTRLEIDATQSWSDAERLRTRDFEQMSAAELAEAARAIAALRFPAPKYRSRRFDPSPHGHRPDTGATLRQSLRRAGELRDVVRKAPRMRPPDLVVLCDISGSMSVYSRMMMRYMHALMRAPNRDWGALNVFTFGTRLTPVTRALGRKDADDALAELGRTAQDWEGGTRIAVALERFNKDWSRRVLGQGAVVLLITDGLERGDVTDLSRQMARLARSSRRLVWLNPLLRWDGFAPKARGIQAMLPHVDSFHACHSVESLAGLSRALSTPLDIGAPAQR